MKQVWLKFTNKLSMKQLLNTTSEEFFIQGYLQAIQDMSLLIEVRTIAEVKEELRRIELELK